MSTSFVQKALEALGTALRFLLGVAMWAGGILLCSFSLPKAGAPFTAMALTAVLVAATVWLHEGGHYLAARLAGMRVMRVWATFADIVPQRRGFRWRWRRDRKLAGAVFAVPLPGQAMRHKFLVYCAGGPAANLLVAIVGTAIAWAFHPMPAVGALWAFAAINASFFLVNLIPGRVAGFATDGQQLLNWWRAPDEHSPEFAGMRLLSASAHGMAAASLSGDDLAELEKQPSPMPLSALRYRIKATQDRGDWDETPALAASLETQVRALGDKVTVPVKEFLDYVRSELAFSEAMRRWDGAPLRDAPLSDAVAWLEPSLRPRREALFAALAGDRAGCERALDEARRLAENELDLAAAPSEARIAALLRERFAAPVSHAA